MNINGNRINSIRYADDTVILCDSNQCIQKLLYYVNMAEWEMGLKMNANRKFMVFILQPQADALPQID